MQVIVQTRLCLYNNIYSTYLDFVQMHYCLPYVNINNTIQYSKTTLSQKSIGAG